MISGFDPRCTYDSPRSTEERLRTTGPPPLESSKPSPILSCLNFSTNIWLGADLNDL